jgi:hypothetical protein
MYKSSANRREGVSSRQGSGEDFLEEVIMNHS